MTSEKVTAGIYYTSLSTIYWCEMILPCCFFFTRDECTFQSPSITNTQSAPKAEEQEKKNWLREDLHAALLCNLAVSCSLLCSRPQEVPEMLTKSRLNPWLRSEKSFSPRHISKTAEHVMWSSPREYPQPGEKRAARTPIKARKGFSRSSWRIKYRFQESRRLFASNPEWTVTFPCRSWCLWSS